MQLHLPFLKLSRIKHPARLWPVSFWHLAAALQGHFSIWIEPCNAEKKTFTDALVPYVFTSMPSWFWIGIKVSHFCATKPGQYSLNDRSSFFLARIFERALQGQCQCRHPYDDGHHIRRKSSITLANPRFGDVWVRQNKNIPESKRASSWITFLDVWRDVSEHRNTLVNSMQHHAAHHSGFNFELPVLSMSCRIM